MRDIVIHFIKFEVMNMHPMIYWGVATVYFMLLISSIMSLRSLSMPIGAKLSWFLMILVLPVLGLAIYAMRCIFKADWNAFEFLFNSRRLNMQVSKAASSARPKAKA